MLANITNTDGTFSGWGFWHPEAREFVSVGFSEGLERLTHVRDFFPVPEGVEYQAPFGGTKILCVGRNFKPHAEELGHPLPKEPLWFSKPPSSLLRHRGKIQLPEQAGRIDYEGEMVVLIGKRTRHISEPDAHQAIAGISLALDITARELQKSDGQWTRAKGFDTFCPLGPVFYPYSHHWLSADLSTELNGKVVQKDKINSMIFSIPTLISHISACMTLEPGDIILTGTPAGVGALKSGDRLKVHLDGPAHLRLEASVA